MTIPAGRATEVKAVSPARTTSLGSWPPRGVAWTIVERTSDEAVDLPGLGTAPSVPLPPLEPGFQSFAGMHALVESIYPTVREEAPALAREYDQDVEWLVSKPGPRADLEESDAAEPTERSDAVPSDIPNSIIFAVVRRVSRESHHSAISIDRLAHFFLEAHKACASLRGARTYVIGDLESWDRPSLRCLHRVTELSTPDDNLAFVAFTLPLRASGEPGDDLQTRVTWARNRFLSRLFSEPYARFLAAPPGARADGIRWPRPEVPRSTHGLFLEVGSALSYQNYERVYLLCAELRGRAESDEDEAQATRLAGLAHAQLGDLPAAEEALTAAARLTVSPTFEAHLEYLVGLLSTKRHYDLDAALAHYARGLAALEREDADPAEVAVERAWLWNGQALAYTLRAKQLGPSSERDELLRRSLELELRAYDLVKDLKTPAGSYLRHNLLANITFLLEISRRYEQAIEFWTRAFERYLAADSPAFRIAFDGRMGLLLARLGRFAEAIASLEHALEACRRTGDPFYEERLCLALGFVCYRGEDYETARDAFAEGARLAVRLRDPTALEEEVSGLLWTLVRSEGDEPLQELLEWVCATPPVRELGERVRAALGQTDAESALEAAEIALPTPSPKLPSYIPQVDLEGTPDRDLNRYLVSAGGPLVSP